MATIINCYAYCNLPLTYFIPYSCISEYIIKISIKTISYYVFMPDSKVLV